MLSSVATENQEFDYRIGPLDTRNASIDEPTPKEDPLSPDS